MKKMVLQSLIIIAFNVVLAGLVLLAFFLLIMWSKPALAAVLAVLALPGILLQPWFILFSLMPGGLITAPVLTTVTSIPIYITLDRKGKLDRAKNFFSHLNKRKTAGVIAAIILCVLVFAYTQYIDFPSLRHGVPRTLEYPLKELNLKLDDCRYYCSRSFLDSEYLCKAKISEHDLNLLADKLRMHVIPKSKVSKEFWNMPPYWWKPDRSGRIRAMTTPNFPNTARGPDGWHFLAIWNPEDQILHMWIKDNF